MRASATARGIALRGVLRRLNARDRVVLTLLTSKRVRRALARRGVVALTVEARDAAGNVTSRRLTVRVKR